MHGATAATLQTVSGPKQARSERTLYRLLDAAEALIAEQGLAGLSIPEVVRRAGSSVGGFYARFRDKNELLRALEERFFLEVQARLDALADERRWQGAPVSDVIAAAVEELVDVTEARRDLIRAFLFRATQDVQIRDDAVRFRNRAAQRIAALLVGRSPGFQHPDPVLAIDLGVQAAFSLMNQHVLLDGTHAAGRMLGLDELKREVARMFVAYVGIPAGPAAGSRKPARKPKTS
ncbi:MAG: helix-turn-helix domain-containing protein [Thermodesulfobacteriota bacterium]